MNRLFVCLSLSLLSVPAFAQNTLCEGEFKPLIEQHQSVMKRVSSGMPKGKPASYEQAVARAQTACSLLGEATVSFSRLNAWMNTNQAFCQIPDKMINDVKSGMGNVKRSQAQACGAVGQLKKNRAQAEAQAAQQQQQGTGGLVGAQRRNDPFSVSVSKKPQL